MAHRQKAPSKDVRSFVPRHIGPSDTETQEMLDAIGVKSLDALIDQTVPESIRLKRSLALPAGLSEHEALSRLRASISRNQVFRSYLGYGYANCLTPPVIQRNVLENPGWYTAYTPYQAEIAQGRLEALLNFQTVIIDLTGLEIANASLLDEGTAAAEAMLMCHSVKGGDGRESFFVDADCHPQTIDVVRTRATARSIDIIVGKWSEFKFTDKVFGALLSYPTTDGAVHDYRAFCEKAHQAGAAVTVVADLMSLVLLTPPGEFGADVCVGNSQRFGVPLGFGGPHAAFFATKEEFKRSLPGRIIGVSRDADGKPALRMALQTREQHIRREKATSNVCTAQVLLAVVASMYAVYHGPQGLSRIARRVHGYAAALSEGLRRLGLELKHETFFDTVRIELGDRPATDLLGPAREKKINLRQAGSSSVIIALDETVTQSDVADLLEILAGRKQQAPAVADLDRSADDRYDERFARTTPFLTHPTFSSYHSETEMLRYMHRLQSKDLSLTTSMIPLGSCTMKLNATAEMYPVTWPEFGQLHPFAPADQTKGYAKLFAQLEKWLGEITGFAGVSLQPNAGSQGEYAGLLVIRAYHESRGEGHRN